MKILILLQCINPEKTMAFYSSLGIKWIHISHQEIRYFYSSFNGSHILIPNKSCSKSSTELAVIGNTKRNLGSTKENIGNPHEDIGSTKEDLENMKGDNSWSDPDGRLVHFAAFNFMEPHLKHKMQNSIMLPILRSTDIHRTRDFYAGVGVWILERHGTGPYHYCFEDSENSIIEIYPRKNLQDPNFEFVVDTNVVALELRQSCDPDGRTIKYVKMSGPAPVKPFTPLHDTLDTRQLLRNIITESTPLVEKGSASIASLIIDYMGDSSKASV